MLLIKAFDDNALRVFEQVSNPFMVVFDARIAKMEAGS